MRNETTCTECGQDVGVSRDWNRRQAGQVGDWKIARHREEQSRVRLRGSERIPLCIGGGLTVPDFAVGVREEVSA